MWRVLWVLVLVCGCATTGTGSAGVKGYSPSNSHFWCGEHCVVSAGCEEGLICGCIMYYNSRDVLMTQVEAEAQLWEYAVSQVHSGTGPAMTVAKLRLQPHEVRVIKTAFGSERVCGVFPKYAQFGENPEATGSAVPDDEVSSQPTVKSGEVVNAIVIHTPTSKEEMRRWREGNGGHIATRERDFVSHTYSIMESGNRVEMVCRFRPGCDNYHLPPDAGKDQDEACVDISTCRLCEKERNWPDGSSVDWAKECLATGKQTMAITASSQSPTTPKEAEEPNF